MLSELNPAQAESDTHSKIGASVRMLMRVEISEKMLDNYLRASIVLYIQAYGLAILLP